MSAELCRLCEEKGTCMLLEKFKESGAVTQYKASHPSHPCTYNDSENGNNTASGSLPLGQELSSSIRPGSWLNYTKSESYMPHEED